MNGLSTLTIIATHTRFWFSSFTVTRNLTLPLKLTLTLTFILLCWFDVISQTRTIAGTLTSEEGEPLPGVNILIKGTEIGTVTDANGNYSISAPVGSTLVFSFIGMQTKEVLVTGDNLSRKKPKKIHERPDLRPVLNSPFFSDTIPEAENGVGVLLDDTPSHKGRTSIDVNTLKSIKRTGNHYRVRHYDPYYTRDPFAIQYTTSVTAEQVFKIPGLQKSYAQGHSTNGSLAWTAPGSGYPFAWGPPIRNLEFDGDPYAFDKRGRLLTRGSGNGMEAIAYDPLSIYRTGWSFQNAIAISVPLSTATALINYENLEQQGVIPNSSYGHTNISARVRKIRLAPRLQLNPYVHFNQSTGRLLQRGANMAAIMGNILSTPPSFDNANGMSSRNASHSHNSWRLSDNSMRSHAPGIADNPYALINLLPDREKMKRLMGQMKLQYHSSGRLFSITANGSIDRQWNEIKHGVVPGLAMYAGGRLTERSDDQTYAHVIITPEYSWHPGSDIKASASYELHYRDRQLFRKDQFSFAKSFTHPWEHSDSSTVREVTTSRLVHEATLNAFYNHWHWLVVRASAKTYFSNTLSYKTYTNLFPSMSVSIDLADQLYSGAFQHIKIYGSMARSLREAPMIYGDWSYASTKMAMHDFKHFFENYELLPTNEILPETENKFETGVLLEGGRYFGFKFTYFNNTTDNFIVPTPHNDGFRLANAARVNNRGTAITFTFDRRANFHHFDWSTAVTWSAHRSVVRKLNSPGSHTPLGGFTTIQTVLAEGHPVGAIWGTNWRRNDAGEMIIDDDGFPLEDKSLTRIGNPIPDWNISWSSHVRWKNLSVSFVVDVKKGGDMWNGTRAALDYAGMSAETGRLRGTSDYIFEGVTPEGKPNNISVNFYDPSRPVELNRWMRYGFDGVGESYIEDASWIRLQDITMGYTLRSKANRSTIREVRFSLTGRNLILITPYSGVDPASSLFGYSATSGLDLFNSPTTRSYNAQITLKI